MATKLNGKFIKKFYELKKEADAEILKIKDDHRSHLQNYLFFMYQPVASYTHAVVILSESGKYNAACVILRCLVEAHINIIYHQGKHAEFRLATSAKSRFQDNLKIIEYLKKIHQKVSSKRIT